MSLNPVVSVSDKIEKYKVFIPEYHKIDTLYKRDMVDSKKLIMSEWSKPEFEYLQNNIWVFTEKVDGTNIRVGISNSGDAVFRGRSDKADTPQYLIDVLTNIFKPLKDKLERVFECKDACMYGEVYGSKIQKGGGNYRKDISFVLFDIRIGDWWLRREDVENIAADLGIDIVPIIGKGTLHDAVRLAREGMKSQWGDFMSEGLVARPLVELKGRNGQRIITKIKHRDFLQVT